MICRNRQESACSGRKKDFVGRNYDFEFNIPCLISANQSLGNEGLNHALIGHASAAIHRAYAKSVRVELPLLEEYERDKKVVALQQTA